MKLTRTLSIALLLALLCTPQIFAQGDLQIFGFYQGFFQRTDGHFTLTGDIPTPGGIVKRDLATNKTNLSSGNIQEVNIFFRKELTADLTVWLNFEYLNSFSTENKWGNLNLEEAWINYDLGEYLNIKVGQLIPRFNYLNEIKNRMPLLPYITRPLVYESSMKSLINSGNYAPEHAFVQLSGKYSLNEVELNYAAYIGNSETAYTTQVQIGSAISGSDTTNFKLFGGRVGLKYDNLRMGVSATFDKNKQLTIKEDVDRTRLGLDFGYSIFNFFVEAEYIKVSLSPKSVSTDMDKQFYYGLVGYDFGEKFFVFGRYSYLEDKQINYFASGMSNYVIGCGFRPRSSVVLKAEYGVSTSSGNFPVMMGTTAINANSDLETKSFIIACSILF